MKIEQIKEKILLFRNRVRDPALRKYADSHLVYNLITILLSILLGVFNLGRNYSVGVGYPYMVMKHSGIAVIGALNGGNILFTYNKRNPIKNIWIRFLYIIIPLFLSMNLYLLIRPNPLTMLFQNGILYGVFNREMKDRLVI